jgi:hypothetical protein
VERQHEHHELVEEGLGLKVEEQEEEEEEIAV